MSKPRPARAANEMYRLPTALVDVRCRACWYCALALVLAAASFASLDLHLIALFSLDSLERIGRFAAEFFPPDASAPMLHRLALASVETLAMSALGTAFAAALGLALALPAARTHPGDAAHSRGPVRLLLNALRAVPELVWASILVVTVGLGPMAGALALAVHTSGVLGRLFAEAIENAAAEPANALRTVGCSEAQILLYATLPQVAPQFVAYTLYRWENNIRAAAVLGIVGAGGLGQMLVVHLGLFQMSRAASVVGAMLLLVLAVDFASQRIRRALGA